MIKEVFELGFPWQTQDPFLFCVHHLDKYPAANEDMTPKASLAGRNLGNDFTIKDGWRMYHGQTIPGFPAHPHTGFETITIVTKGFCDHSDSLGAAGRFGEGDVQWMTAGKGVQHSEMFPLLKTDSENTLELFQIWLNLPSESKFVSPHFKMLWHEDIPVIEQEGALVKLIAGSYADHVAPAPPPDSWAAKEANDVSVWLIEIAANKNFVLPKASANSERMLYLYNGDNVVIGDDVLPVGHGARLVVSEDLAIHAGASKAFLLLLGGRPIKEPVVKYGPFVMNTEKQIQNAMDDYRTTQFGGWPWRHSDNTHDREKGRFAKYPDGSLIEK